MTIEQIARIAHQVDKAYCLAMGDDSQPDWEDAPDWQKSSARNGVIFNLNAPDASPEDFHDSWISKKHYDAWKYGLVENPETKEHPCLLPYEQLPVEQRVKVHLFKAVVKALAKPPVSEDAFSAMNMSFNPSSNPDIDLIKSNFAQAYDAVEDCAKRKLQELAVPNVDPKRISQVHRWASIAKTHLEEGHMATVKAITR